MQATHAAECAQTRDSKTGLRINGMMKSVTAVRYITLPIMILKYSSPAMKNPILNLRNFLKGAPTDFSR
jgi:hypothetical protein